MGRLLLKTCSSVTSSSWWVFWKRSLIALRICCRRKDRRAHVLEQDRVELGDRLCRTVILLHQLFAGAPGRESENRVVRRARSDSRTGYGLRAGRRAGADARRRCSRSRRSRPSLPSGDESVAVRDRASVCQNRRPARSRDRLQVAQSSRAFLAVGLEAVGRFFKAEVTLVLFDALWNGKTVDLPSSCSAERAELGEDARGPARRRASTSAP